MTEQEHIKSLRNSGYTVLCRGEKMQTVDKLPCPDGTNRTFIIKGKYPTGAVVVKSGHDTKTVSGRIGGDQFTPSPAGKYAHLVMLD